MAHWAELDDNDIVLRVIVCDADDGADGAKRPPAFCTEVLGGRWARTYYDTPGKTFAGVGDRHLGDAVYERPDVELADPMAELVTDPDFQALTAAQRALVTKFVERAAAPPPVVIPPADGRNG